MIMLGKFLVRTVLQMIVWVYIFSISWSGQTLFDRVHELMVDNDIIVKIDRAVASAVKEIDESAMGVWSDMTSSVKLGVASSEEGSKKKTF